MQQKDSESPQAPGLYITTKAGTTTYLIYRPVPTFLTIV